MPNTSAFDNPPITVGLQFTVTTQVRLMAILWWQATTGASLDDRTVGLYTTNDGITGSLINGIKTQAVSGTGWQTVTLDTPITLAPGKYIAAVFHPTGQYSVIGDYYIAGGAGYGGGAGITTNEITVPSVLNAPNGRQNVFAYSNYFSFPHEMYSGGMYGIDILVDNGPVPPAPDMHVYDGNAWRGGHLHVYNGTAWVSGAPSP